MPDSGSDPTSRRYWQVDVFSQAPLAGNPLGVVFDSDGLDGATMQAIARELNHSETVFFCPPTAPEADYRIRIFTPKHELAIAGHPSIGAAFAHTLSGGDAGRDALTQQCGAGLVRIERVESADGQRFSVCLKPPGFRDAIGVGVSEMAEMLGCQPDDICLPGPEVVSTGIPWLIAELSDEATIAGIEPDYQHVRQVCERQGAVGLTVFAPSTTPGIRFRTRSFAPGEGVAEDPACGSGNGSVAGYVWKHREVSGSSAAWTCEQGLEMGRGAKIYVELRTSAGDHPQICIGGHAVRVLSGSLEF